MSKILLEVATISTSKLPYAPFNKSLASANIQNLIDLLVNAQSKGATNVFIEATIFEEFSEPEITNVRLIACKPTYETDEVYEARIKIEQEIEKQYEKDREEQFLAGQRAEYERLNKIYG